MSAVTGGGYLSEAYAASLSEFGTPVHLPGSGGWLLARPIGDSGRRDAMGCYPLFLCEDWARLPDDLASLSGGLVSIVLVTDPFAAYRPETLEEAFPDLVRRFKRHYVLDLLVPLDRSVSRHHRYYGRKAAAEYGVEVCADPAAHLDEWHALYRQLIERHGIRGISAFSKESFRRQLQVPGVILFRATQEGETVGMQLWMVTGEHAYHHLSAYSEAGYRGRASYALLWYALNHLQERGCARVDLGGGAGLEDDPEDGLARFKRGWTQDHEVVHLCGRILDRAAYQELSSRVVNPAADFFPAYRRVSQNDSAPSSSGRRPG